MNYGLTIENTILIIEKAKSKNDGCYRFRGIAYRVRNKCVTHLAYDGKILERFGNFNTVVGSCWMDVKLAQEKLKTI